MKAQLIIGLLFFLVLAVAVWWLILPWINRKKGELYHNTDRRVDGLWLGDPPAIVSDMELQTGDVLFCSPHIRKGWLIQQSTAGVYTHCAIYIGDSQVADSTPCRGVSISPLSEFDKQYRYIAVARCPGIWTEPNDSENRQQEIKYRKNAIKRYVKICEGMKVRYNPIGALFVPFREWLWIKQSSWERNSKLDWLLFLFVTKRGGHGAMFCSEFVHRCFVACGHLNKEEHSHLLSPNALSEDDTFGFVGYRSLGGLQLVNENDPFLDGCSYVLH